jgi:hypothetical protein
MARPHEPWSQGRGRRGRERRLAPQPGARGKARYIRDANLKALYGISLPDYEELLQEQGGVCAICARPPRGRRPLDVDHDPDSGKVRGLLCGNCNRAIGLLDENPELFDRAKDYIARFK